MNILVSILSDQTIPNISFIEDYQKIVKVDKYIFVTTKEMQNRKIFDSIISVCNLDKSICEEILVEEDNLNDINKKLTAFSKDDYYFVNITGGTKIMSLGVYNYFKDITKNIFYLPIGKNSIVYLSENKSEMVKYKINVKDYFKAYNITSTDGDKPLKSKEYTKEYLNKFLNFNDIDNSVLKILRTLRDDGIKDIKLFETEKNIKLLDFLNNIEFVLEKENKLSKKEIQYLTGGWFEEYVYSLIASKYNDFIMLNPKISKSELTNNELDVVFTFKNSIYVIECKTLVGTEEGDIVNETIYKIQALKKDFGLTAKSYLFTLDEIKKEAQKKRAKSFDINIIDKNTLLDEEKLNTEFFNKIFN